MENVKFTTGEAVRILSGTFRGQTGTVLKIRTDKNGVVRTQVETKGGIFSYMLENLEPASTTSQS